MRRLIPEAVFALTFACAAQLAIAQQARNLMVEVRIEGQSTQNSQGLGVGVQQGGWGVQGGQRQTQRRDNSMQRLMVMDGGTATLSSVKTQPLRLRQTVIGPYGKVVSEGYVYRSLGGGIRVTPRSRGDVVDIEVSAEEARPVPNNPAAAETMRLSTMMSGRMGEWIQIADDQRGGSQDGSRMGITGIGQGTQEDSGSQQVWLRVSPSPY